MGFDPDFLHRLNQNYDELDLEDLQSLNYEATGDTGGELEPGGELGTVTSANFASAPIPIPSPPKQQDALMSDAAALEEGGIPQVLNYPNRPGV